MKSDVVAWGVLHLKSGRFDGWYFEQEDAEDVISFLRDEFKADRFALVGRTALQPARTWRTPLRPYQSSEWAVSKLPGQAPQA